MTDEDATFEVVGRETLRAFDYPIYVSDLAPDGSGFLAVVPVAVESDDESVESAAPRTFLVVNWFEELRARMGN